MSDVDTSSDMDLKLRRGTRFMPSADTVSPCDAPVTVIPGKAKKPAGKKRISFSVPDENPIQHLLTVPNHGSLSEPNSPRRLARVAEDQRPIPSPKVKPEKARGIRIEHVQIH